jgi:hypothetical protein
MRSVLPAFLLLVLLSFAAPASAATAPDAPTGLSAVRGSQTADLTFTAPASDGGDAIIGYEASTDGGGSWLGIATSGGGVLTATIGNLTDGTHYDVIVRAVNNFGRSPASASAGVTPADVPATGRSTSRSPLLPSTAATRSRAGRSRSTAAARGRRSFPRQARASRRRSRA